MNQKQSPKNSKGVTQDHCSEESCSNCYIYSGCMHQPYSFWQALCDVAMYRLQQNEQLKAMLNQNTATGSLNNKAAH